MDYAHPLESPSLGVRQEVFHDGPNLSRRNRVQVNYISEFNEHRIRERILKVDRFILMLRFVAVGRGQAGQIKMESAADAVKNAGKRAD